jgi:hypothetical protein
MLVMNDKKPEEQRGFSTDFKILIAFVLFFAIVAPPLLERIGHWQERKRIYRDSLQRVDKAGGWQSIENASLAFATNIGPKTHFSQDYYWRGKRLTTNELSPTLEALQPWRIQFEPDEHGVPMIRIRLFGIHRTGTYDEPYYGIWVVCTNASLGYVPQFSGDWAGWTGKIERKGNSIFEAR